MFLNTNLLLSYLIMNICFLTISYIVFTVVKILYTTVTEIAIGNLILPDASFNFINYCVNVYHYFFLEC